MILMENQMTTKWNIQNRVTLLDFFHFLLRKLHRFSCAFQIFQVLFIIILTLNVVGVSLCGQLKRALSDVLDIFLVTLLILLLLLGNFPLQFFSLKFLLLLNSLESLIAIALLFFGQLLSSLFLFFLNLPNSLLTFTSKIYEKFIKVILWSIKCYKIKPRLIHLFKFFFPFHFNLLPSSKNISFLCELFCLTFLSENLNN